MKPPMALMLIMLLASPSRATALDANKAAYVGGTVLPSNAGYEPIEGRLDLGPDRLLFIHDAGPHAAAFLTIDYDSIRGLEFGQHRNRHLPLVVGATVLLGPVGLLSLSARRRVHYLTVLYADDLGTYEAVILELGKHVVRSTLDTLEARTGVEIEYQDEAAREWRR
jgi:hypothetical protein